VALLSVFRTKVGAIAAGVLLLAGAVLVRTGLPSSTYELNVLVPAADGLFKGSDVRIAGLSSGSVEDISVQGNLARIKLGIDKDLAPLHAGTQVLIRWNSVIGRRYVDVVPGPSSNPVLADGKLIEARTERVELDDIVAMLDAKTRSKVKALVGSLDQVLSQNHTDLNKTLDDAGPFVNALGQVLAGVGQDGPAIRDLVTRLQKVVATLAVHHENVAGSVRDLRALMDVAAREAQHFNTALNGLPSTVQTASRFFGHVPAAVDAADPLLRDLQPAIAKLPETARKLSPVLHDLRPTVADLRPTLAAAQRLLASTPGLLAIGTSTVPSVDKALTTLEPAVSFLRPYTPEVVGFLTNWASLFDAKNAAGHFGRAMIPASVSSFNSNPGVIPPGMSQWKAPAPGALINQPWVDANGDSIR
jgi:phospholipid/cholesterol/gamma-HCH transport system substrate-binding protein